MRILLCSSRLEELQRLTGQLSTDKRVSHMRTVAVDSTPGVMPSLDNVDVLILDDLIGDWISVADLEKRSNAHPEVIVMLVTRQDSSGLFIDAVGAGVRNILRWPATPAEIDHAIAQCAERLTRSGSLHEGRVFSIIGTKGGSGATFVALNLAHAWATHLDKRTLLIDLDLQYGDASFGLGETKQRSNVVQCVQEEPLERSYLESVCIPLRRNLYLLASPVNLEEGLRLEASRLEGLIDLASRLFDVVIIDLPLHIDARTVACMTHSNQALQVVTPTVAGLRNQQRQLQYLHDLGIPLAKVGTLVNCAPVDELWRMADPFAAEIERHLGSRTLGTLPRDDEAAALALGAGEAVTTVAPDSRLAAAFSDLAGSLLGVTAQTPTPASKALRWFSRLRR
jgi:pilus assembly protein CpaE